MSEREYLVDQRGLGLISEVIGGSLFSVSVVTDALSKISDMSAGLPFHFGMDTDLGYMAIAGGSAIFFALGFGTAKAAKEQMINRGWMDSNPRRSRYNPRKG